jgi:hypothetical protein
MTLWEVNMNLRIAECCGSCKHSNKPKKPEDHAAHYSVAKTERWCYKNGIPVTRESVCDNYEMETKKGAVPAFKRILAFNKKLEKIIEVKNWMEENNIEKITYRNYDFAIVNGKVCYRWNDWKDSSWYLVSCKDSQDCDRLVKAVEEYKNA